MIEDPYTEHGFKKEPMLLQAPKLNLPQNDSTDSDSDESSEEHSPRLTQTEFAC